MIDHDEDFVVGLYPSRREDTFLFRPCYNEDGSIVMSEKKLLKMEYIPSGFMLIKRHVIEKMIRDNSQLYCEPKDKKLRDNAFYCLFNTEVFEGEFWGEDYVFCRRARASGFDIWVDPVIEFDHFGVRGMFASILTDKKELSNKKEVKDENAVTEDI
jgi:hypothetical protein